MVHSAQFSVFSKTSVQYREIQTSENFSNISYIMIEVLQILPVGPRFEDFFYGRLSSSADIINEAFLN